jgi:FixJ family two-component response regulator
MSELPPLIAVVDDDASVRRAIQRLIRALHLRVETYASGGEFLDSRPHHKPDCVILDLHMPGVDGFDVLLRLKDSHPREPVIFITGHDSPEAMERAQEAGAEELLRKPVNDAVLLAAIQRVLKLA